MSLYDKSSLVLIPSGTKTGKVYSQKPVSGDGDFTFTRSSAATRVNADGNIEKETQNLLLQSNTFSNTWTNASSTETSGQSGYDGTNDAWLLTSSLSGGRISQSVSQSGLQTFSVYLKAGSRNWALLVSTATSAYFDLVNGVVGSGGTAPIDANIESIGSGWYRCSIAASGSNSEVRIYPALGDNDVSGTGTIYIQDAQLEQGLVARDYIETTTTAVEGGITDNVPRLDYTDSSCPALLLEPQRSNLFEFSEYFGTSDWSKDSISITTNDSESVEGVNNATLLYPSSTGSISYIHNTTSGSASKYTISAFVKADGKDVVWLYISSGSGNGTIYFDLSDESIQVVAGGNGTPIGTITDIGNDWYRITFTLGSNQQITSGSGIGVSDAKGSTSVTKSGEDGILIYGLQIEEGSYATSYIPTYGSSVTRVAESLIKTNVSSILNDDAGTLFLEIQGEVDSLSRALTLSDGTSQNRVQIFYQGSTKITTNIIRANVSQVDLNVFTKVVDQTATLKVIIRYEPNNAKMFVNGEQIAVDTSVNIPLGLNKISFDNGVGSSKFTGKLKNLIYIPTALTDQEAIDLTTI